MRSKGSDVYLSNIKYDCLPSKQLQSYLIVYIGKPQFYNISSSLVQLTLLKAPIISSCRSNTIVLQSYTILVASVTRYIANLVDHLLQFLVQSSRSKYYDLAVSVIYWLIILSIIFPTILRRDIGLQSPIDQNCIVDFLGL